MDTTGFLFRSPVTRVVEWGERGFQTHPNNSRRVPSLQNQNNSSLPIRRRFPSRGLLRSTRFYWASRRRPPPRARASCAPSTSSTHEEDKEQARRRDRRRCYNVAPARLLPSAPGIWSGCAAPSSLPSRSSRGSERRRRRSMRSLRRSLAVRLLRLCLLLLRPQTKRETGLLPILPLPRCCCCAPGNSRDTRATAITRFGAAVSETRAKQTPRSGIAASPPASRSWRSCVAAITSATTPRRRFFFTAI